MASRRIRRTKSLAAYAAATYQDLIDLKARSNYRSIAASAISGDSLAEEVEILNKSMQSSTYLPGVDGWRIDGSGNAEFGNVYVRGDINAYSGTIGYWNISNPAVERTFGDTTLFGTFLESFDHGFTDEGTTSGTYVSLFKSYIGIPTAITKISVTSDIVTLTVPNHDFTVGDRIIVEFDDNSYADYESETYLVVTEITPDTLSYVKRIANSGTTGNTVPEIDASGLIQIYNEDIAGLYLRDYAKNNFDYGYFSNTGVAYVSAEDINIVENPSFEYNNGISTSYSTTSWSVVGTGLTISSQDFSSYIYKNSSSYGQKVAWTTETSDYVRGTIDYLAASNTQLFGLGKSLYFGATIFPVYTSAPTSKTISSVQAYNLSKSVTSATATATTITYTGTNMSSSFYPGQYVSVSGFSNSRFNISNAKVATATSTEITVEIAGAVVSTETATKTMTSGLLKVVTSTSHGFSAGNTVFLDVDVTYTDPDLGEITATYSPHLLPDSSLGYTYIVAPSPTGTATELYLIMESGSLTNTGINLDITSHYSVGSSTPRSQYVFLVKEFALDLSSIRFRYSNNSTTSLSDVLATETLAYWSQNLNKSFYVTANAYMLGYLDSAVKIPAMTKLDNILIDNDKLNAAYAAADSSGYALKSDISLDIPGWLVSHDGNGVIPTSPTKISNVSYILDDVYLSTTPSVFYVDPVNNNNRWYTETSGGTVTGPGQASIEGTKTWINVDLNSQSANLDYFDYVGLRNNSFTKSMLSRPALSVFDSSSTYLVFPDSDYETTTLTGGTYRYLDASNIYYTNVNSSLKLITGDRSSSFELFANAYSESPNSPVYGAVISGITDQSLGGYSTIYAGSDKFIWTTYLENLSLESLASVVFTSSTASFSQKIKTSSSISATTSITGATLRLTSTAQYSLSSTSHPIQIGLTSGDNVRIDNNGIQAVTTSAAASTLNINTFGGTINAGSSTSTFTVNGYLRVESSNDVSLISTNHPLQIGSTTGTNLRLDANEIQAVNNGAANTLNLQASGGNIVLGNSTSTTTISNTFRLTSTENATLSSTIHPMQIGNTSGVNTRFDYNGIQTVSNGSASTLVLNGGGGNVSVGSTGSGTVVLTNYSGFGSTTGASINTAGAIIRTTSSARYKQDIVEANYAYDDILLLTPKQFRIKEEALSNKNSKVYGGFIAEDLDQIDSLKPFVSYLILEDGSAIPDGIAYGEMVSVLVSAIKHQDGLIKSLTSRLDALEDK